MAREDHGFLAGHVLDKPANLQYLAWVQADGGLVQDQDRRISHKSLGQAHPLAEALAELFDELAGALGDARGRHDPLGLAAGGEPVQALGAAHELQVLADAHVLVKRNILG